MPGVLKPGCIEPVEYFRRGVDGHLMLAAYSGQPTPDGYVFEYVDTLRGAEWLEKELARQDAIANEREYVNFEAAFAAGRAVIRDRLRARMVSSATSQWEKDFLELWFRARDERREKFMQRWLERTTILHALNFDTPKGRRVDEEKVNLDRINF